MQYCIFLGVEVGYKQEFQQGWNWVHATFNSKIFSGCAIEIAMRVRGGGLKIRCAESGLWSDWVDF